MITTSELIRALDYAPILMSKIDNDLLDALIYKINRVNDLAEREWEYRQFKGMRLVESEEQSHV